MCHLFNSTANVIVILLHIIPRSYHIQSSTQHAYFNIPIVRQNVTKKIVNMKIFDLQLGQMIYMFIFAYKI